MSGPLEAGTRLGPYEIRSLIGRGGMGEVYLAHDTRLDRPVALKLLSPEHAGDHTSARRLIAEARAASSLNHPNIVTVYDIGDAGSGTYLVMEHVAGKPLRLVLGEEPMAIPAAVTLARDTARALSAAHAAGIVHRDIKPENLMLRDDGWVKVLDFGLARRDAQPLTDSDETQEALTREGTLVGTPRYMSPEQARGHSVESASDIFSLGVVLYEALTGRRPFDGESWIETLHRVVSFDPPPLRHWNPAIPPKLDALVRRMLAKHPAERPTAAGAAAELELALTDKPSADPVKRNIVGRDRDRERIFSAIDAAAAGRGSMVSIGGEPGLGKTTLVDSVLDEAPFTRQVIAVRGNCSERLGGAEAYLPFLEILDRLAAGAQHSWFVPALRRLAPSWAMHVLPDAAAEAGGASVNRAQREFLRLLGEASERTPLVLLLEDVHWADTATVDLLAYIATSLSSLRIVILATYRPSELLASGHPFNRLKLDLESRGVSQEVRLGVLTQTEFDQFTVLEFPGHAFPASFSRLIHQRTDGNPLFMTDILRYLRDRGALSNASGRWELRGAVDDIGRDLPASVRSMIERKIGQLSDDDRRFLICAAVQGPVFESATVCAAANAKPEIVEDRLEYLERIMALVRYQGEIDLPSGEVSLRYAFQHVLYQNALYDSLRPTQRASLSRRVAEALHTAYGDNTAEIDSQLAFLHEAARDLAPAARHAAAAARSALRRAAPHESVAMASRGLGLVDRLPPSPDRDRIEADLLVTIGIPTTMLRGFGSPDLETYYNRLRALGERTADKATTLAALTGLFSYFGMRGECRRSLEMAEVAQAVAQTMDDPAERVNAGRALGFIQAHVGRFDEAEATFTRALSAYDPETHGFHTSRYAFDPFSASHAFLGWMHAVKGRFAQAAGAAATAIRRGLEIGHGQTTGLAYSFAAFSYELRGDLEQCLASADLAIRFSEERELAIFADYGRVWGGWAGAALGDPAGVTRIGDGLRGLDAIGSMLSRPHFLGLLADAHRRLNDHAAALESIAAALESSERTENSYYDAELWRVQGEIFRALDRPVDAETSMRRAHAIATSQDAHLFELRAALSLHRLSAGNADLVKPALRRLDASPGIPEAAEALRAIAGE